MMEGSAGEREFEHAILSNKKSESQKNLITNVLKNAESLVVDKEALNVSTMDLQPTILQPSIKLKQLKIILAKKFECLSIYQTISRYSVPFLHIWKPISKSEGVQGMDFLPCFHIIVTLVNEHASMQAEVSSRTETNESYLFQLHSFHGKVLAEELHYSNKCGSSTYFNLVSKMANNAVHICHGIDDILEEFK